MEKVIKRLFNAIKSGRFNYEKYLRENTYYGVKLLTQPLFCSYGQIGFEAYVYDERGRHIETIVRDWDLNKTYLESDNEN